MARMLVAALFTLLTLPSADLRETQRCGPVVVEGVSWTASGAFVQSWVRTRRKLGDGGVWGLSTLRISHPDGSALRGRGPLAYGRTAGTDSMASLGLTGRMPARVRVEGELVHYQTVEEAATFPVVHLELSDIFHGRADRTGGKEGEQAMRVWEVPRRGLPNIRTPRGLGLGLFTLRMAGMAGIGFDDLSRYPVRVVPGTLNAGLSSLEREFRAGSEERVDARDRLGQVETIYQKNPPVDGAVFSFRDKNFKPDESLSLQVIRMFPVRRYRFSLVLPVQAGKNPFWGPDPAKKVIWPKH